MSTFSFWDEGREILYLSCTLSDHGKVQVEHDDAKIAEDTLLEQMMQMEKLLGNRLDFTDLSGQVAFSPITTVANKIVEVAIIAAGVEIGSLPASSEREILASCSLSAETYLDFSATRKSLNKELRGLPSIPPTVWMDLAKKARFWLSDHVAGLCSSGSGLEALVGLSVI